MANTRFSIRLSAMRPCNWLQFQTAGAAPPLHHRARTAHTAHVYPGDPVVSNNAGNVSSQCQSQSAPAGRLVFWGCHYYSAASKIQVFSPYWPGVSLGNSGYV